MRVRNWSRNASSRIIHRPRRLQWYRPAETSGRQSSRTENPVFRARLRQHDIGRVSSNNPA